MMQRRFAFGFAVLLITACTTETTAPSRAATAAGRSAVSAGDHDGGVVPGSLGFASSAPSDAQRLACNVPSPLSGTALVGPSGGELDIGPHRLIVPPGALITPTEISGTIDSGSTVVIHFEPSGLQFKKPAGLIFDAASCGAVPNAVYLDEQGGFLERIQAVFSTWWHTIAAPIDHFSNYAIDV